IQLCRLVCGFCSSGQRFACGFLRIPPRGGHPCRPANDSPCRGRKGLSPSSECALPGAQEEKRIPPSGGIPFASKKRKRIKLCGAAFRLRARREYLDGFL